MSFPRYPAYKPSGVEWLGEVPEHWVALRIRFAVTLNPSKHEAKELGASQVVSFLPMEAIGEDGSLRLEHEKPVSECLSGYTYFRDGDVCLAKITPCFENGKGAILRGLKAGIGFGTTELIVARPETGRITTEFLDYVFRSQTFRQIGESEMYGAGGQKRVPDSFVRDFTITLPSTDEQIQITTFLDRETTKIDTLIAEQQRLIKLLQEKRQAVISHAVSKGLNPHARMKDSGVEWLGEVPEHWRNFRLKALFALKHGYAFDGSQFSEEGEYVLMTPGNFIETGGFRRKDPEKYYVGSDMPSEFILQGGEMLIAMTEQAPGLVGATLIAPEGEQYLHNQRLGLVTRLKEDKLCANFLYWLMNSPLLKAKVGVTAAGQKVRHTSPQKILDNEACLPPLEEQKVIAQALFEANERCIRLTENAYSSIRLLVERRSALISAAVTGQIDVRGLAPEASAA